jgi:hypothetical protein
MVGKHRKTQPREELEKRREEILRQLNHPGPPIVRDLILREQLEEIDKEIEEHF